MIINCKRIMALVRRDMVESTPVIIFSHEYPILQSIHGDDNISIVTDPNRIIAQSTEGLTKEQREAQIEKMMAPQDMESADEYNRLAERYGMHPEVSVPVVESRPESIERRVETSIIKPVIEAVIKIVEPASVGHLVLIILARIYPIL